MITEDQLEQLSLDWFRETGWEYANGVEISPDGDAPERDDYRVVVLKDRLAEAVARLNPDLPQSAVDDVVHQVANPDDPSLEQNNRALHRVLHQRRQSRIQHRPWQGNDLRSDHRLPKPRQQRLAGRQPVQRVGHQAGS